jgi:hypothetical protein
VPPAALPPEPVVPPEEVTPPEPVAPPEAAPPLPLLPPWDVVPPWPLLLFPPVAEPPVELLPPVPDELPVDEQLAITMAKTAGPTSSWHVRRTDSDTKLPVRMRGVCARRLHRVKR